MKNICYIGFNSLGDTCCNKPINSQLNELVDDDQDTINSTKLSNNQCLNYLNGWYN